MVHFSVLWEYYERNMTILGWQIYLQGVQNPVLDGAGHSICLHTDSYRYTFSTTRQFLVSGDCQTTELADELERQVYYHYEAKDPYH